MASGGDKTIKPEVFLKDFYLANLDKICQKYNHEFASSDVIDIDSLRICEDNGKKYFCRPIYLDHSSTGFLTNRKEPWKFGKRISSVLPKLGNYDIEEEISKRSSGEETIGSSSSSATSEDESIDSIWESSDGENKSDETNSFFFLKDLSSDDNIDFFTMHQKQIDNLDRYFKSIEGYICTVDDQLTVDKNYQEPANEYPLSEKSHLLSSPDDWSLNLEIASTLSMSSRETSEESAYKSMGSSMKSRKRKLTLGDIKTSNLDDLISVKQYDILGKYFNSVEHYLDIEEPVEKRPHIENYEPRHFPP